MSKYIVIIALFSSVSALAAPKFTGKFTVDTANCNNGLEGAERVYGTIETVKLGGKSVRQLSYAAYSDDATGMSIQLGQGSNIQQPLNGERVWKTKVKGNVLTSVVSVSRPKLKLSASTTTTVITDHGQTLVIEENYERKPMPAQKTSCRLVRVLK